MNRGSHQRQNVTPIGIGFYTIPEASRLLKVSARTIRRWLGGYSYKQHGKSHPVPPLWQSDILGDNDELELSFRDLIELRFVNGFVNAGVGLSSIRHCLDFARALVNDDRPFSTQKFQTDGRKIFLESIQFDGGSELLDLKNRQYEIKQVIERTFKDLDIEDDAVARWRPFRGKDSIVIDPTRAFGQPIAAEYGVPTVVLADAVRAEGSIERVARLYEVKLSVVRDAVNFEEALIAA